MGRKQYSSRTASVTLAMFFALCASAGPAAAGDCPPGIDDAARAVAALHGLETLPVRCETVSRTELAHRLRQQLEASLPVPLETELEVAWRLGLTEGRRPETLEDALLGMLEAQVLGYYDPETDTVVLVSGTEEASGLQGMATMIWAHEVEHAYQEYRYGLGRRLYALRGDTDAQLAASAVAEGDAVLVMTALALPGQDLSPADLADGSDAIVQALGMMSGALGGSDVPKPFVEQLLFPYREGTRFVAAALRNGGWEAVGRLLATPPVSTEQVLHPDRHDDVPSPVGPGDLPAAPGWEPVLTDVTGEWGFIQWLGLALPEAQARRAAAGWDGDRTRVSRSETDPTLWRLDLVTVWDTATDAAEAAAAFQEALPKLLDLGPGGIDLRVRRQGLRVTVVGTGRLPAEREGDTASQESS